MTLFLHYYGLYAVRFSHWISEDALRGAIFYVSAVLYFPFVWLVTKEMSEAVHVVAMVVSAFIAVFLLLYLHFTFETKRKSAEMAAFLKKQGRGRFSRKRSNK